ncbi:MAG: NADH-quinone oxidoreductase subunit NuoF, partial [Deltaproteobacteria bacterium]|nr:NADH-quinone oxidoreductase subunit NuoF [Deltaproteobacteria bacterium]
MIEQVKILSAYFDDPAQCEIEHAQSHGAYQALRKAVAEYRPDEVIALIHRSGLRGRGGAGFPTGTKWELTRKQPAPRFLCCNADEGEPGTFKDKAIIERDPHLLLEGMALCCYAVGIERAFIYIRGEYAKGAAILQRAIDQATRRGFIGSDILGKGVACDITIHQGAGSYICGEETALIASLQGYRGLPQSKPPYPASDGLFHRPTVVNNVETLANIPRIVQRGAEWFGSIGAGNNRGTRLFSVSGHVKAPGLYELPIGTPLSALLELAGGIRDTHQLKAVIPGGCSSPVVLPNEIDVAMDFESLAGIGSSAGTGAVIVIDETACLVKTARRVLDFYRHECCGQCTPGRIGVGLMADELKRIEEMNGSRDSLRQLERISDFVKRTALCELGKTASNFFVSTLRHFRE